MGRGGKVGKSYPVGSMPVPARRVEQFASAFDISAVTDELYRRIFGANVGGVILATTLQFNGSSRGVLGDRDELVDQAPKMWARRLGDVVSIVDLTEHERAFEEHCVGVGEGLGLGGPSSRREFAKPCAVGALVADRRAVDRVVRVGKLSRRVNELAALE